jgi:hypothetical protein
LVNVDAANCEQWSRKVSPTVLQMVTYDAANIYQSCFKQSVMVLQILSGNATKKQVTVLLAGNWMLPAVRRRVFDDATIL